MKKLFTFWMLLLAMLAMPQTIKATDFYVIGCFSGDTWGSFNEQMPLDQGVYTLKYTATKSSTLYFRFGGSDWNGQMAPSTDQVDLLANSPYLIQKYTDTNENNSYPYANYSFKVTMTQGKTYTFTFSQNADNSNRKVTCVEGNGTDTPTPTENPIANRTYTEGYYLVGNFFNFDGSTINYDDAVFKFQQQKSTDPNTEIYMTQIPATLTAHAQVMSVNALGQKVAVFGPSEIKEISNSTLKGINHVGSDQGVLTPNAQIAEDGNYFDFKTRRTVKYEEDGGQDGSYTIYVTFDKTTNTLSKWEIKYSDFVRVAYYLSTEKDASAMVLTSSRVDASGNFNSGKYMGSLYTKAGSEFYAVSNAARNIEGHTDYIFPGYNVIQTDIDILPTYPKLFLWGNGGKSLSETANCIAATNGTFKLPVNSEGMSTWEFNSNQGNNDNNYLYGNMGGQVLKKDGKVTISSVSMVGPAIPGTMNDDNTWNWTSKAADMTWDASENCYKLSLVTSVGDGEAKFRFVGNHDKNINWYENTLDNADEKAKTPYQSDNAGHAATASDPNEVSYTQDNVNSEEGYHIIWNRPAGNWTVRFYIYTYTGADNNPAYRYFYTITENHTLELRDFANVVYKSEDNERKILLRGNYDYFRTWSEKKAWKVPDFVHVFIVDGKSKSEDGLTVNFSLKSIDNIVDGKNVIPASTGVILAVKGSELDGKDDYVLEPRKSLTSYNTLKLQMEEASDVNAIYPENLLKTAVTAQTIPTSTDDSYNYLFGFYHANTAMGVSTYDPKEYLLGFWISNGNGSFYSNSAYLPVPKSDLGAFPMLGTSYHDFEPASGAKKVPALFFDFSHADDATTAIKDVQVSHNNQADKYFTLGGQQISKPSTSGVYIHNGKKYIIK